MSGKPPWLHRRRSPSPLLTPQARDRIREVAAAVKVPDDVVIDAAARVITPEQVQQVIANDTADIAAWRRG